MLPFLNSDLKNLLAIIKL